VPRHRRLRQRRGPTGYGRYGIAKRQAGLMWEERKRTSDCPWQTRLACRALGRNLTARARGGVRGHHRASMGQPRASARAFSIFRIRPGAPGSRTPGFPKREASRRSRRARPPPSDWRSLLAVCTLVAQSVSPESLTRPTAINLRVHPATAGESEINLHSTDRKIHVQRNALRQPCVVPRGRGIGAAPMHPLGPRLLERLSRGPASQGCTSHGRPRSARAATALA